MQRIRPFWILCFSVSASLITGSVFTGCSREETKITNEETIRAWESVEVPEKPKPVVITETAETVLQPGEQFRFKRVITEELLQDSFDESNSRILTRFEQDFTIMVQDRVKDQTKLGIHFDRVQYSERVDDDQWVFDSSAPGDDVPEQAMAYQNIAGNGFSIWTDENLQIVSTNGFQEFLARQQPTANDNSIQQVEFEVAEQTNQRELIGAVSEFVGLLPVDEQAKTGTTWQLTQKINRPIPLESENDFSVLGIDENRAKVEVRGKIVPSSDPTIVDKDSNVEIFVSGGETTGSYTIDRKTGFTQSSKIEQTVQMRVRLAETVEFGQVKKITTTLEALDIDSEEPPSAGSSSANPLSIPGS